MARKSAKNKKALKRKNEASKRSRVLKQRQDYTVGGRVKAFNGLPDGVQAAMDAAKKAEEARTRATQSTQGTEVPGQGGQSDIVPTPVKTRPDLTGVIDPGSGTGIQLPTTPVPSDMVPTPQTPTPEPTGVVQPGVGTGIELPKKEEPAQQVLNFGTRYDGKEFTPQNYERISRDGGDRNRDKFITNDEWVNWMLNKGPDEGVSEQGIPFGTIWREKLTEAAKQGALTNSTRDRLKGFLSQEDVSSIYAEDKTGYVDQGFATERSAAQQAAAQQADDDEEEEIPYDDSRLADVNDPAKKNTYYNNVNDRLEADNPFLNDEKGSINLEPLQFSAQETEIFNLNMDRWLAANARPQDDIVTTGDPTGIGGSNFSIRPTQRYNDWRSSKAAFHNATVKQILRLPKVKEGEDGYRILPVSGTEFKRRTTAPYKIPAMDADDVADISVTKVSDRTTDDPTTEDVDERTRAETFQMDRFERDDEGNIQFDDAGNPIRALRDVAELTEEEKVAVDDIIADTVVTKDDPDTPEDEREISLTDPSVVAANAKALGVTAPAMRGFLAAEANYFNK